MDLREDVRQAIEGAWPSGVMEMAFDSEESYFLGVYPKLRAAIRRLKGSTLMHEHEPDGGPIWYESDPDEDPPDDQEFSRSYHLFFVSPDGKAFIYESSLETTAEAFDEDEAENDLVMEEVAGTGRTGWCVAVSLLAPFAVITLGDMATLNDGSISEPSLDSLAFDTDPVAEFRKLKGEQAFKTLEKLRGQICRILESHGIGVLPEEEWRKPVPWLRADPDVFSGIPGEPLRVLDALFFRGL